MLKRRFPDSDVIHWDAQDRTIYILKEVETKSKRDKRFKLLKSFPNCDVIVIRNVIYIKLNPRYEDFESLGIDTTKQEDDQLESNDD
jgi:hypothetical protein